MFGRQRMPNQRSAPARQGGTKVARVILTVEHLASKGGADWAVEKAARGWGRTMMVDANVFWTSRCRLWNARCLNTIGDAELIAPESRNAAIFPVVIEQHGFLLGRLCDPVICMAEGKVLAQGDLPIIKKRAVSEGLVWAPGSRTRLVSPWSTPTARPSGGN